MIYKALKTTEHEIQKAFFQWVRIAEKIYPALALMFAVPNAGKRGFKVAAMMIAEGLRRGVPDVIFPVARGGFFGLAIEFKSASGGLSDDQAAYIVLLEKEGWKVVVLRDSEAAIKTVKEYLGIRQGPISNHADG